MPPAATTRRRSASVASGGARRRRSRSVVLVVPPPTPSAAAQQPPPGAAAQGALATFAQLRAHPELHYLADNDAIVGGYRGQQSWAGAAASIFTLHNESLNICSHGLAAAVFFGMAVAYGVGVLSLHGVHDAAAALARGEHVVEGAVRAALLGRGVLEAADTTTPRSFPQPPPPPLWPILLFLLSAAGCLGASAAFHTLHTVSRAVFDVLAALDYAGIALLIWGSTVAVLRPYLACRPGWADAYTYACTAVAAAAVAASLSPRFSSAEYRLTRMRLFIGVGASGVLPMLHMAAAGEPVMPGALPRFFCMGGLYVGGALLYGYRVPERFAPGWFDIVLSSHQLFHVAVVAAAGVHLRHVLDAARWRAVTPCGGGGG